MNVLTSGFKFFSFPAPFALTLARFNSLSIISLGSSSLVNYDRGYETPFGPGL